MKQICYKDNAFSSLKTQKSLSPSHFQPKHVILHISPVSILIPMLKAVDLSLLQLNYSVTKIVSHLKISQMDEQRLQRQLQESESSNHLISYSRLADQIDMEEELKNNENWMKSMPHAEMLLALNEQPRVQHKIFSSEKREQNQQTFDGLDIRIHYQEKPSEKDKQVKSPDNQGASEKEKDSKRGLAPADHLFKLTSSKVFGSGILGAIMENQNENKRSDEEMGDAQALLESKCNQGIKINNFNDGSLKAVFNINKLAVPQGVMSSSKFQQRRNDINIRAIDDSVQVQRHQPQKIVTMIRDEDRRSSSKQDKKVLSSLTTASKLVPKGIEAKVEREINEDHYFQMMNRISRLENEVQTILAKKKMVSDSGVRSSKKERNSSSVSVAKGAATKELRGIENSFKICQLFSPQKRCGDRIEQKDDNLALISFLNRKIWKDLSFAARSRQMSKCLKEIARMFDLSPNFEINSTDPFIALFSNRQMVRISYSKKIYIGSYTVELYNYIKDGFGIEIDPFTSIYKGNFSNGQRQGEGKYIKMGRYTYQGKWLAGVMEGRGVLQHYNGDKYSGSFIDGKKEGMGVQRMINGDRYEGQYMNNLFHGRGMYYWANGAFYEGEFRAGKLEGSGKWRSANDDRYEGKFVNGLKSGWGIYTWKNGNTYEGEFLNGSQVKGKKQEKVIKKQKNREQGTVEVFKIYFKQ